MNLDLCLAPRCSKPRVKIGRPNPHCLEHALESARRDVAEAAERLAYLEGLTVDDRADQPGLFDEVRS